MTAQQQQQWAQAVARAWSDEGFKKRLLTQPAAALKEVGVEVPAGLQLKVLENTDNLVHLILPPRPGPGELTDDQLAKVSGGLNPQPEPPGRR
jgi:hypothetical protein